MSFQSAKHANGSSNREAKGFLFLISVLILPFLLQYGYRWLYYTPKAETLQITYLTDTCGGKKPYTTNRPHTAARYNSTFPEKTKASVPIRQNSVDLNTADSAALVALPGIGPSFASRIVKYRTLLGGYVNTEQLKEVYGMPDDTYTRIKPLCTVSTAHVKKISADTLWNQPYKCYHPYLSKELKASINTKKKTQNYSAAVLQEMVQASNGKLDWYLVY